MSSKKRIISMIIYALGIFITGLGANVLIRSSLGAGAWDAVAENFRILASIRLAYASLIINTLVLIFVIIYNKDFKFLISLIPIAGIFVSIYFWDVIVLDTYYPDTWLLKSIFFLTGLLAISFGLAAMVASTFPAMVYDELTIAMMNILHIKSFFKTRIIVEMSAVIIGSIIGLFAGITFGAVGLGTVLISFILGPLISVHLKWLSQVLKQKRI